MPVSQPVAISVGVAGGSGSGKSTLLRLLVQRLGPATVLDLDSYYLDRSRLAPDLRQRLNYDEPAAFDLPLLLHHLRILAKGRAIDKPRYSFHTHTREGSVRVSPSALIFVEGLFTLWWQELRSLLDITFFLDAPAPVRFSRRAARDVAERGRTEESVTQQYLQTVRPMHERYIEPTRVYADYVLDNSGSLDDCLAQALSTLDAVCPKLT